MKVNSAGLHRVERGIAPRFGKAITIPVGPGAGRMSVYVTTSAFDDDPPRDTELIWLASAIATLLERLDEPAAPKVRRASPRAHVRRTATGWTLVGSVESDNEPEVAYQIKRKANGALGCDCMAYRFAKGEKTCKHIQAWTSAETPSGRGIGRGNTVVAVAAANETFTVRRGISFGPLTAGG